MLQLISVLVLFMLVYFYKSTWTKYKHWENKGVPYIKPTYPFGNLGGVVFRRESFCDLIHHVYRTHKRSRFCGLYQCFKPTLMIRDPDLIKQITTKDFDAFPNHDLEASKQTDPLWANTLIMKKVEQDWSETRTKVSPVFKSQNLRIMIPLMQECAQNLINYFKSKQGTVTMEMKSVFRKLANDIITSVAFGVSVNSFEDESNMFHVLGQKVSDLSGLKSLIFFGYANFPGLMKFFRIRLFSKEISDFFTNFVKDTIRVRGETGVYREDFIHLLTNLIDDSNRKVKVTSDEITANGVLFFFAGSESLSSILAFSAYEFALTPDIQNKVYNEIVDSLEKHNGSITYELVSELSYFDNVVSELLRLHTPNIGFDRKCLKSYVIEPKLPGESPVTIDKNTGVWIPVREIHRDPQYYPDPEKFDPERFNSKNKAKIRPNTYIPFGHGPRRCIGARYALLKMKVVLIEIMRHYEFVRVQKTEVPVTFRPDTFFMVPKNGVWIGLKPRF